MKIYKKPVEEPVSKQEKRSDSIISLTTLKKAFAAISDLITWIIHKNTKEKECMHIMHVMHSIEGRLGIGLEDTRSAEEGEALAMQDKLVSVGIQIAPRELNLQTAITFAYEKQEIETQFGEVREFLDKNPLQRQLLKRYRHAEDEWFDIQRNLQEGLDYIPQKMSAYLKEMESDQETATEACNMCLAQKGAVDFISFFHPELSEELHAMLDKAAQKALQDNR